LKAGTPGPVLVALCAGAALASFTWVRTVGSGAHLLHFDAKAHLVVARRVLDSLTPGWVQLGAVWLPLPHILNVFPCQSDLLYRTGLFASALGFVSFVAALAALASAAVTATGDRWAGVVALAVPALNPGWLYLQATPLIEALFLVFVAATAFFLTRWSRDLRTADLVGAAISSALACLVRYEAWLLCSAAFALVVRSARPRIPSESRRRVFLLAFGLGIATPIVFYGIHSWVSTGIPLYVIGAENLTEKRFEPGIALALLRSGIEGAFGRPLTLAAIVCGGFVLARREERTSALAGLAAAGLAPAAVTFIAYFSGHPPKARYPLLLVVGIALLVALATRSRRWAQAAALAVALSQGPAVPRPLPILSEATRDRQAVAERTPVVDALREAYQGGRILASMGSLAPVLFELRLPLREIVHEGNGNWWTYAVVDPGREVSWIVIAKGDVLDQVRSYRSGFPEGFVPVMGFTGVDVYRRGADLEPRQASVIGVTARAWPRPIVN
jgi:hypothetical protein